MKKSFVTPILKKIARELAVRIEVEPRYQYAGRFVLADGSYRYFRGTNMDINPLGASEIAQDKDYAQYFLQKTGYGSQEPSISNATLEQDDTGSSQCQ